MQYDYRQAVRRLLHLALGTLLALGACSLLGGCKTAREVIVTHEVHDTLYQSRLRVDSFLQRDSIYVHEYSRGDTIFLDRTRWLTTYRDRLLVDTAYVSKRDSVVQVREVERKLTKWQQTRLVLGDIMLTALLLLLLYGLYRLYRHLKP